ncbi:Trichodiene oxygenase 5, partial [Colletotrichum chlorophyti]
MTSKYTKDPSFYRGVGGGSRPLFVVCGLEEHRKRRAVLNPFFSRRQILKNEHIAQEKTDKIISRINQDTACEAATNLTAELRALSVDVFTSFAFGEENCFHLLDDHQARLWFDKRLQNTIRLFFMFKPAPWLEKPFLAMPEWLAQLVCPTVAEYKREQMVEAEAKVTDIIQEIKSEPEAGRDTIYHTLLSPAYARAHKVLAPSDIVREGSDMLNASENTAKALAVSAFGVMSNKSIYSKLHTELKMAFPCTEADLDFQTLESLPYLTAVIKEGLRLSYGALQPLPRTVPKGGETFNGVYLPEGTVVGLSNWMMHRNPAAFPKPDVFDPERWLDPQKNQYQEEFFAPFSRGTYQCIGQTLAVCELYVAIGRLFWKFDDLVPWIEGVDGEKERFQTISPQTDYMRYEVKRFHKHRR